MAAVNLQRNTKSIGLNKQQHLCRADTHCVGLCQLRPPGPYCAFPHRAGPTITQQTFPAVPLLLWFLNNEGLAVAAFINVSFTSYSSNANLSSFNFCPSHTHTHTNTLSESASCPCCSCQIVFQCLPPLPPSGGGGELRSARSQGDEGTNGERH